MLGLGVGVVANRGFVARQFGGRWLDEHDVFNHVRCIVEARLHQVAPKTNHKLNSV